MHCLEFMFTFKDCIMQPPLEATVLSVSFCQLVVPTCILNLCGIDSFVLYKLFPNDKTKRIYLSIDSV